MAKDEQRGMVKYDSRGQEVILSAEIVRNFLITGKKELVTDQEIFYFLGICKARGLNPFLKDVYLIKYGSEPAAIVTSIDFYRSRARAAKDCTGWEKGVICLKKDGELRYSKGLVLPDETLVGGWFRARPTGWTVDFMLEVNLAGYIKKTFDGKITKFWSPENQPSQIMKVAESQGLRTVWPDLFQGTYTADELSLDLDSPGTPPPAGAPSDITPPPPEKLDTSAFDKAVKKLKWDKETMVRLEKWLADTATGASSKTGKVFTSDMIKVSIMSPGPATPPFPNRYEEFQAKFKEWQDVNYPAAPPETPSAADEAHAAENKAAAEQQDAVDRAKAEKAKEDQGTNPNEAKPFAERKEEAWRQVVTIGITGDKLAPINISVLADVNEDNIDELEELIAKELAKKKK